MSYESEMLKRLAMPSREKVKGALLRSLFLNGGTIKEFGSRDEGVVTALASEFGLEPHQRSAVLKTVYRKQNRTKIANLWNRLLFRAADTAAKEGLLTRPTQTVRLTQRREWMLTERGFDVAMVLLRIPPQRKADIQVNSYEVQRVVQKMKLTKRPTIYNPIGGDKKVSEVTKRTLLRSRGFRQAILEAYDRRCAVCGFKMCSPDFLTWEVEAAHLVPHHAFGRDDVWNGIALCRVHHWALDVGWFTLNNEYRVELAKEVSSLPLDQGRIGSVDIIRVFDANRVHIQLPKDENLHPHPASMAWHRDHVFNRPNLSTIQS